MTSSPRMAFVAALMLSLIMGGAVAQQYPAKPITVIFTYPASGSPIVALRLVTEDITARTGRSFIIDPKPGGQGAAGLSQLSHAEPDGYTLGFTARGALVVNPYVMQVDWKPQSFTPIMRTFAIPVLWVSDPNFPAKNLADTIKLAKEKPNSVSVVISGAINRVTIGQIEAATGAKFLLVPTTQVGRILVMGGHANMGFEAPSSVKGLVQEGKLNAIAIGSTKRFSYMPNVPTMAETVPGMEATTWFAFLGPKGMAADKVSWLTKEVAAALKQPAVTSKLEELGYEVMADTTQEFDSDLGRNAAAYEKIIRELNITN